MQKSFPHVQILKLTASLYLMLVLGHSYVFSSNGVSRDIGQSGACYKHSQSDSCENAIFKEHDHSSTTAETDKMTRGFYKPDPRFHGVYTFPTDSIPRRDCSDEEAMQYLRAAMPVVLENCTFPRSALKWTTEYLLENLKDENHTAYLSTSRKFLYFDEDRLKGNFKLWKPPTTKMLISFKHFLDLVQELKTANNGSRAYFQSVLFIQDGVSSSMLDDINSFDYDWLFRLVTRMHWGEDVTNLILVGMPDVVTPAHYDSLENLYVQISGRKRVILFNPEYFRSLYPYPVGHPHDRQTQVEFDDPDFSRFPRFREIKGMEVALEPGEVLYIPSYWWHHIESEKDKNTVSVNFWFDPKNESEGQTGQEEVDTSSYYSGVKENDDNQPQRTTVEQTNDDHITVEANEKLETQAEQPVNDETSGGVSETFVENGMEEEREIDLTASGYLALVREIEVALFKATFSHKKMKQILEEMLFGRFNNL